MKLKIRGTTSSIVVLFTLILTISTIQESRAEQIERVGVEEAFEKMNSGKAIVVCSYDDNACKKILFDGALLRSKFESMIPSLSKDQEIFFYCN